MLALRVAVVAALSLEPAPDPLVPIAGGPGQASSEFYAASSVAFEKIRRNRDIVLLDQRGTGDSAAMDCAVDDDIIDGQMSLEQTRIATEACLESLPHDPRFFTTSVAVTDLEALRGISFKAEDGRITGLLGPNGAGKSTTLRALYTVLKPDQGRALIDGIDVVAEPLAARGRIGALPHRAGLYPHLTARENIRYYARMYGLPGETIDDRVQAVIDEIDIGDFADRRSKGFSQGQQTKVSLARALVHQPNNIILDAPSNGLDVMATRSLRDLIRKLKNAGKCVLFSSHVMQEVAALCDDIVIIAAGRVALHDTPDNIRARTGCDDLEDAFVRAIEKVEPA